MDYRFAHASDIPALAAFTGDYYAGERREGRNI